MKPLSSRSFFALCILSLIALIAPSARAQFGSVEIFSPDWSMTIDDYGYSDLAFDQRPGYEGREYLSGEWAAAIAFTTNSVQVGPTWLNDFLFPDWVSNTDFGVQSGVQQIGTNQWGFSVIQSVITNKAFRVRITSEMVDTTNGIAQGTSPASAGGPGSFNLSDRYVMRQTFAVTNISGQLLSNVKFFKFLHSLQATQAVYDNRLYNPTFNNHRYTITQEGVDDFGFVQHYDKVALHANTAPSVWEVGYYGVLGIDDHVFGKPSVGVHLSVEGDALSGLDAFSPDTFWVSGAMRHNMGGLAANAGFKLEFLMTIQTESLVSGPFEVPAIEELVGWGNNAFGQINSPAGLDNLTAIAAGGGHNLAILEDGSVLAWGKNTFGQTNVPEDLVAASSISAGGNHSLAIQGSVIYAWGDNSFGQTNAPAVFVTAVSAGSNHSLALGFDSTVVAWGNNSFGQTNVPAGLSMVAAISAGGRHNLALGYDYTVVAWGDNSSGQTNVPADLAGMITAVAAGGRHSLALRYDGIVIAWGDNSFGQTNVPPGLNGVTAIAAGDSHSVALKTDGTVVAWGKNTSGQASVPGDLFEASKIAAGGNHTLAVAYHLIVPTLSIRKSGSNVILSWPVPPSSFSSWWAYPEKASALIGSPWSTVTTPASLVGGAYEITLPIENTNRLFRLRIEPE